MTQGRHDFIPTATPRRNSMTQEPQKPQKPVAHIRTSPGAVQGLSAPLVQTRTGGQILCVEQRSQGPTPPGTRRYRTNQIEDAHVAVASASRALLDIAADSRDAFIHLLTDCPGTAADYQLCLLTVSGDEECQLTAFNMANAVVGAGMTPGQVRFIRVAGPRDPAKTAYPLVAKFYGEHGVEEEGRAPAVLDETELLLRIHGYGERLGDWLHGKTDFQALLDDARRKGAGEEALSQLMHKVMLQRKFALVRDRVSQVFDSLGLTCISSNEWLEEAAGFASAPRSGLLNVRQGGEDPADVNPVTEGVTPVSV
jgi:hypothetical protein